MKVYHLLQVAFISILMPFNLYAGTAYYVSPNGAASWSQCTNINTPCSLSRANANADDDDIVYLREGTYDVVYDHGVLEPEHSGSNGHTITFIAYPGETPIIDGSNTGGNSAGYLAYSSYITFDGLTFSNPSSNWSVVTGGYGLYMVYDGFCTLEFWICFEFRVSNFGFDSRLSIAGRRNMK